MAFIHRKNIYFLSFFTFLFLTLPLSHSDVSIQELLIAMGLPRGLLPKDVKSYTLSSSGLLEVFFDGPCLTQFDTTSYYQSTIRANLTHGSLTGVEGLYQKELFLWLPVKDMIVRDPKSGIILIDIGLAFKELSLSLFSDPPHCQAMKISGLNSNSKYFEAINVL